MSEPLHETRGIVPLFEEGSLDASEPFLASPLPNFEENLIYAQYDKRLKTYLIGALDIFRQYEIFLPGSDIEAFQELVDTVQKQLIPEVEVQMALDCNEVEACLDTSPIITNIENTVVNLGDTVNNHTTEITNINNNVTNLTENVTNIEENVAGNVYPPAPSPITEITNYCGSAWEVAEGLNDLIQDVITDALTFTFAEFIESILSAFTFKFTFVRALWDFVVASANPNISSEVTASIPYVAEAIYCSNLDLEQAKTKISNDGRIPNDSRIAYNSAIDAMTASKINSLVYVGSLNDARDCSTFACSEQWYNFMDFSVSSYADQVYAGNYTGEYWESENVGSNSQLVLGWRFPTQTWKQFYFDAWKIDHASISHVWQVLLNGALVSSGGINNNVRPRQFTTVGGTYGNVNEFRIVWQATGLDKQFRLYSGRLSGIGINPKYGVDVVP